ncbi:MAG: PQQ-binding-like beta-propeller repeat protein [Gammaproteobacteria bacterium]
MKVDSDNKATKVSASISGLLASLCLTWWFTYDPTVDFVPSVPGMDNRPVTLDVATEANTEVINIGEYFETYEGQPGSSPGTWPRFRGAGFDNINTETVRLADKWGESGPKTIWSVDLGEGHAAPAVSNGRVYVLDYDEDNRGDALRCFSLDDGKEIWRRWYRVNMKRNHGFSRTIPAVTDQFVVTIGPKGYVMCVDAITGDFLWGIDLVKEYGTEIPFWYTGQCPLIDDSVAVIAPGGKALMIGVNCSTGKKIWETPNPKGWQMSHSSIVPIVVSGKRVYAYSSKGGFVGVSAEPDSRGELLWASELWSPSVGAPSPVALKDGRIFIAAGYGSGSVLLKVAENNGNYSVEKLLKYKPEAGMASEQQTPIYYKGYFYAILPKDAGVLRNQLVCYHPDDITTPVWTSGKTNRFGLGPYLIADNKMFVLNDNGVLTLLRVSTRGYNQLAQAQIMDATDAWGPMALVNGRLLLRDAHKMICIDVSAP